MSSSKNTPPHYKELCKIDEMFYELIRSRPEDQSLSTLCSQVAFFRAEQNQRSKLAIEALPTVTSPPNNDEKCQICLNELVGDGKQVKEMVCKHLFHRECIVEKALGVKLVAKCPICGEKVLVRADKLLGEDITGISWMMLFFKRFKAISNVLRGGGSSA